jgi:tetratricopeptide (TPR) repeat protein
VRQQKLEALLAELEEQDQSLTADQKANLLREATRLADYAKDPELWAGLHGRLGTALQSIEMSDTDATRAEAIAAYQAALTFYSKDTPGPWAITHYSVASLSIALESGDRRRNIEDAIEHAEQALSVADLPALSWLRSEIEYVLGHAHLARQTPDSAENVENAVKHLRQAADAYPDPSDVALWALPRILIMKAYLRRRHSRSQNVKDAIKLGKEIIEVVKTYENPALRAETYELLGDCYSALSEGDRADNIERAIDFYTDALATYGQAKMSNNWAAVQNKLGANYLRRVFGKFADNAKEAIQCHDHALQVYTRSSHPPEWASTQAAIGNAFIDLAATEADAAKSAIEHYESALEILTPEQSPAAHAAAHTNLAIAWRLRRDGARADNLRKGVAHLQKALAIYDHNKNPEEWATAQGNLGTVYAELFRAGEAAVFDEADRHLRRALQTYSSEDNQSDRERIFRNLAELYSSGGRWHDAAAAYQQATELAERELLSAYTEEARRDTVWRLQRYYPELAYCLLKEGAPGEALERFEWAKTRLLAEILADDELLRRRSGNGYAEYQRLRLTVGRLEAEMRTPMNDGRERNTVTDDLRAARLEMNRWRSSVFGADVVTATGRLELADILALASPGGALVVPLPAREGRAVVVVRQGATAVHAGDVLELGPDDLPLRLARGNEDREIKGFEGWLLYMNEPQEWQRAIENIVKELWDNMLGPVHARLRELKLPGGTPALFLLYGRQSLLPWIAGWRLEGEERRTFVDDYTVLYAPSSYAYRISAQRAASAGARTDSSLLAVINPLGDLPNAQLEGDLLAFFFPPESRQILPRATASELLARLSTQKYLHLGCHVEYDWKQVSRSALLLTGGTRLTLADLLSLPQPLTARLVTLAGCSTGMFEALSNPEEYFGLPAAFLRAGAAAVICTLWPVDDEAGAVLLCRFYELHFKKQLPPATPCAARRCGCGMRARASLRSISRRARTPIGSIRSRPPRPGAVSCGCLPWNSLSRIRISGQHSPSLEPSPEL